MVSYYPKSSQRVTGTIFSTSGNYGSPAHWNRYTDMFFASGRNECRGVLTQWGPTLTETTTNRPISNESYRISLVNFFCQSMQPLITAQYRILRSHDIFRFRNILNYNRKTLAWFMAIITEKFRQNSIMNITVSAIFISKEPGQTKCFHVRMAIVKSSLKPRLQRKNMSI